jgi:mono/diheme cytochrome c family protein
MRVLALTALAALSLAGCKRDDMYTQDKQGTWDRETFFKDQSSMRPPVPGAVARNPTDPDMPQPREITAVMLERGHQRYNIFCSGCHGASGDGLGMITQRGFQRAPPLWSDEVRAEPASYFYNVITNGQGGMYSFATRVPSSDRWAITAYIRAIQASQAANPATLPDEDLAQVEASK